MNDLSLILGSFCSDTREIFKSPVLKDDTIYVSDAKILGVFPLSVFERLSVKKEDLDKEFYYVLPTEKTPDFKMIASEKLHPDVHEVVLTLDTVREYAELFKNKDTRCPDCNGSGFVEFSYESTGGAFFYNDEECPVCHGRGTIDKGIVTEVYKGYPIELSYFPKLYRLMSFFNKSNMLVYPTSEAFLRLDFEDFYFIIAKSFTIVETLTLPKSPKSFLVSYQDATSITTKTVKIFVNDYEDVRTIFTDVCHEGVITMIEEV